MNRREFLAKTAGTVAASAVFSSRVRGEKPKADSSGEDSPGTEPRLTGSFFDLIHVNTWDAAYWTDKCRFWSEVSWRALIRQMHDVGIDTAICVSTAFWGRPLFPGYEKTLGVPIKFGCDDPLGVCFDEARKLGMKMFFGAGLRGRVSQIRDYSRMDPPWPEVWFRWNTALAEALVDRFGDDPSFGGLYIPYEIDFEPNQIDLYEKWIGKYLRPAVGKVKLLASPGNIHEAHCATAVKDFPKALERLGIDILAPQDYGGRSHDVKTAVTMAKRNADALARLRKPAADLGVTLWANCELFILEPNPSGRGRCIPGPIDRLKQQIAAQAPVAEKLICYQYQGIMNKHTDLVNIGHPTTDRLHGGYVEYLKKEFPVLLKQ